MDVYENGELRTLSAAEVEALPANTPGLNLTAYAAKKRYEKEIGGCAWNGHTVSTDRDSQAKLTAEFVAISAGLRTDPSPWKFSDGEFGSLTNVDMSAVCLAARTHIAACFAAEAQAVAAISGGTITTTAQIDALFA